MFHPYLAFLGPETWLIIAVAGGVLLFGADKLPKLARSAGQAKKEFLVGQAEADVAAEKAREEARKQAEANVKAAAEQPPTTTAS
jgi:sec-independent protein translocase protein TatA